MISGAEVRTVNSMTDWLAQLGQQPTALVVTVLSVVMILDAIPLLGVLVPGDVAVLAAVGVSAPAGGPSAFLAVVGGCVVGWSLSFFAGRFLGTRLRRGRIGRWIGESRWAAAEAMLGARGGIMVLVAPFLPVLNALLPLAAGGLRMPYRRFVSRATVGAALWAGLYVLLGIAGRTLGGLLPGGSATMLVTITLGMVVGTLILLDVRRRFRVPAAGPSGPRLRQCRVARMINRRPGSRLIRWPRWLGRDRPRAGTAVRRAGPPSRPDRRRDPAAAVRPVRRR